MVGGSQGFCDDSTKVLILKGVTIGVGDQNVPNFRDVIYGRPNKKNFSTNCGRVLIIKKFRPADEIVFFL